MDVPSGVRRGSANGSPLVSTKACEDDHGHCRQNAHQIEIVVPSGQAVCQKRSEAVFSLVLHLVPLRSLCQRAPPCFVLQVPLHRLRHSFLEGARGCVT